MNASFCVSCGRELKGAKWMCQSCVRTLESPNNVLVGLIIDRDDFRKLWFISGGSYSEFLCQTLEAPENKMRIEAAEEIHQQKVKTFELEQRAENQNRLCPGQLITNDEEREEI